jgi:hypothetical protein
MRAQRPAADQRSSRAAVEAQRAPARSCRGGGGLSRNFRRRWGPRPDWLAHAAQRSARDATGKPASGVPSWRRSMAAASSSTPRAQRCPQLIYPPGPHGDGGHRRALPSEPASTQSGARRPSPVGMGRAGPRCAGSCARQHRRRPGLAGCGPVCTTRLEKVLDHRAQRSPFSHST